MGLFDKIKKFFNIKPKKKVDDEKSIAHQEQEKTVVFPTEKEVQTPLQCEHEPILDNIEKRANVTTSKNQKEITKPFSCQPSQEEPTILASEVNVQPLAQNNNLVSSENGNQSPNKNIQFVSTSSTTSSDQNQNVQKSRIETNKKTENDLDNIISSNASHIFKDIIYSNLFSEKNKYVDDSIFEITKPYLKEFFASLGFDWDSLSDQIINLCKKSSEAKELKMVFDKNYLYLVDNKITIDWEVHYPDWLKSDVDQSLDWFKSVVDQSINLNKPLTMQFARMTVAYYYYRSFSSEKPKEALYKDLLRLAISEKEFSTWIVNTPDCFTSLVKHIQKRFRKIKVEETDDRILITQLVKSKYFRNASSSFDFLDISARNSMYSSIYTETIESMGSGDNVHRIKTITDSSKAKNDKQIKTQDDSLIQNISQSSNSLQSKTTSDSEKEIKVKHNIQISDNRPAQETNITPDFIKEEVTRDVNDNINKNITLAEKVQTIYHHEASLSLDGMKESSPVKSKKKPEVIHEEPEQKTEPEQSQNKKDIKATSICKKALQEDDKFDLALQKLGGKRKPIKNEIIPFLESVESIIPSHNSTYNSNDNNSATIDKDIENLLYL